MKIKQKRKIKIKKEPVVGGAKLKRKRPQAVLPIILPPEEVVGPPMNMELPPMVPLVRRNMPDLEPYVLPKVKKIKKVKPKPKKRKKLTKSGK